MIHAEHRTIQIASLAPCRSARPCSSVVAPPSGVAAAVAAGGRRRRRARRTRSDRRRDRPSATRRRPSPRPPPPDLPRRQSPPPRASPPRPPPTPPRPPTPPHPPTPPPPPPPRLQQSCTGRRSALASRQVVTAARSRALNGAPGPAARHGRAGDAGPDDRSGDRGQARRASAAKLLTGASWSSRLPAPAKPRLPPVRVVSSFDERLHLSTAHHHAGLPTLAAGVLPPGCVLLPLSFALKRRGRLLARTWRRLHYLGYVVWCLALLHGLGAGTDTQERAALAGYGLAAGVVVTAATWRVASGASAGRRRVAGPRRSSPLVSHVGGSLTACARSTFDVDSGH